MTHSDIKSPSKSSKLGMMKCSSKSSRREYQVAPKNHKHYVITAPAAAMINAAMGMPWELEASAPERTIDPVGGTASIALDINSGIAAASNTYASKD